MKFGFGLKLFRRTGLEDSYAYMLFVGENRSFPPHCFLACLNHFAARRFTGWMFPSLLIGEDIRKIIERLGSVRIMHI